ncbi:hypothetical protein BHM03_00056389, partial [Ensete ventricosum]
MGDAAGVHASVHWVGVLVVYDPDPVPEPIGVHRPTTIVEGGVEAVFSATT